MPQVKELKGLDVAGSATTTEHEFFIQWHLTERCNLRCSHCYQTGLHGVTEPSIDVVGGVVKQVSTMLAGWAEMYDLTFSPSFTLTGGEPFLRPDIFEIIEAVRSLGFEVALLSNGTLISGDHAGRLSGLGVERVQVSFEGPEGVHDAIRGNGGYARALRGVRHLLDAGVRVSMNCTLSRVNAPFLKELIEVARDTGVERLGFSRLVPAGKGQGLLGEMLTSAEVDRLYREVLARDHGALEVVSGDPVAAQLDAGDDDLGDTAFGGCAAGVSGLTILPDGTITPCRRLPIPLGNVGRDSLREIWAASPVLNRLRDRNAYPGKCGACPRWAACRGCRAIAYAFAEARGVDDYLADDPQCPRRNGGVGSGE
jgi:radical SAM protein with 4Fe4S-binding SPASM domain